MALMALPVVVISLPAVIKTFVQLVSFAKVGVRESSMTVSLVRLYPTAVVTVSKSTPTLFKSLSLRMLTSRHLLYLRKTLPLMTQGQILIAVRKALSRYTALFLFSLHFHSSSGYACKPTSLVHLSYCTRKYSARYSSEGGEGEGGPHHQLDLFSRSRRSRP